MEKIQLEKMIKFTNGLNVITNAGVGIKDLELAYDVAVFKAEAETSTPEKAEVAMEAADDLPF